VYGGFFHFLLSLYFELRKKGSFSFVIQMLLLVKENKNPQFPKFSCGKSRKSGPENSYFFSKQCQAFLSIQELATLHLFQ
jgi:hypothetical protein